MLTKMCRDCVHYEVCAHKVDTDANMDGACEHFKDRSLFGLEPIGGSVFDRIVDGLWRCIHSGDEGDCRNCPYHDADNCTVELKNAAHDMLISINEDLIAAHKQIARMQSTGAAEWTSVHTSPPEDEDVLVYAYSNRRDAGVVTTGWWTSYAGWQLTGKRDPSEWIVTHWMPMPPAPENKGRM